ncbi:MAG: 3'(2'),5'-bisphosphate nucleotidase CysQ [Hyphomicrobiaceae bacterium]|nr:3'(2'),5'-bisphosphate nucleotidase CysQ [Hyphomicrobiaceae bacterium]
MHTHLDDLDLIRGAAAEAGAIALGYFGKSVETRLKNGTSPVTEADFAVDRFLKDALLAARPDYGWLSEESEDDPARLSAGRLFVVDPIDGTRGFIEGLDVWTVSVAVVENDRPVAAVLFNPVRAEMFSATAGGGASMDGMALSVAADRAGLTDIATNWRHRKRVERLSGFRHRPALASLAYQIGSVANGRFHGVSVSVGAHDWDLAAADLLVHEAGGIVCDLDGRKPSYNRPSPRHDVLLAGEARRVQRLRAAFAAHPEAVPGPGRTGAGQRTDDAPRSETDTP